MTEPERGITEFDRVRERGTVTAFVTVATVAMLMATGLVLDGGKILAAHREAEDQASAAARAGAQAVDVDALRVRSTRLDPRAAVKAARAYLGRHGYSGTARVRGDRVEVRLTLRQATPLLSLVGMRTVTVTGNGEARIVRGVTRGET